MGIQIHQNEINANRKQSLRIEVEIIICVGIVSRCFNDAITAEVGRKTGAQIKGKGEILGEGFRLQQTDQRKEFYDENSQPDQVVNWAQHEKYPPRGPSFLLVHAVATGLRRRLVVDEAYLARRGWSPLWPTNV